MAYNNPFPNGNPSPYRRLKDYPPRPPQLPKRGYSTGTKVLLGCAIAFAIIVFVLPLLVGVCFAVTGMRIR